jgi:hypothetical protein
MTTMTIRPLRSFCVLFAMLPSACGAPLPDDVPGYQSRCIRMNAQPIPRYDGDPHKGVKNVFACNVDQGVLQANTRPFPDGTLIVKESTREGEGFAWLIATARRKGGSWQWDEYTRNFDGEDFRHILAGESVCTGCHTKARSADWIFTSYSRQ